MTSPLISPAPAPAHVREAAQHACAETTSFNYCCETCYSLIARQDFSYSSFNEFLYLSQRTICVFIEDTCAWCTQPLKRRQETATNAHQHVEGELCARCISASQLPKYSWLESLSENAYVAGQLISLAASAIGAIAFGIMFLLQFLFPPPKRPQTPEEHIEAIVKHREEEYKEKRRSDVAYAECLDHRAEERRYDSWAVQAERAREYEREQEYRDDAERHKEDAEDKYKDSLRKKLYPY